VAAWAFFPVATPARLSRASKVRSLGLTLIGTGRRAMPQHRTEGGEKALAAMRRSKDWAAFALALPMRADPGSQYAYCSCNNHLLSSVVTATTGESLLQFAEKNLFHSIGIADVIWPPDPKGQTHGWGDLHLHPHDMARLGFLYL